MTPHEAEDARRAGTILHHTQKAKDALRRDIMDAPVGVYAVTVTEHHPMRWRAAREMVEAGELVVLSETRCPTRRGPAAADGQRRVRREMRVTLAGWDPVAREFRQDEEERI